MLRKAIPLPLFGVQRPCSTQKALIGCGADRGASAMSMAIVRSCFPPSITSPAWRKSHWSDLFSISSSLTSARSCPAPAPRSRSTTVPARMASPRGDVTPAVRLGSANQIDREIPALERTVHTQAVFRRGFRRSAGGQLQIRQEVRSTRGRPISAAGSYVLHRKFRHRAFREVPVREKDRGGLRDEHGVAVGIEEITLPDRLGRRRGRSRGRRRR